jgi:NAD(P)-dependent dehydrogenase (short-subunit alcohol dehydrogenase family)
MTSLTGLKGRVALITGVDEGVGRATALMLARSGADVAVHALANPAAAEAVAAEARSLGVKAATVSGDVAKIDEAAGVAKQAADKLGPVDVLANTVGIRPHSYVVDMTLDEWRVVMDTNCSSFYFLAQALLPSMTERGFGRLVAVSVAPGDRAIVKHASVAAARAALYELVKVVAVETGGSGVTANVVAKALSEDGRSDLMTPELLKKLLRIPRPGKLDEIAFACAYLASEQGAFITGQTLHVDGGYTI